MLQGILLLMFSFNYFQDTAIDGYTPLDVITEMHLHLWDSAIDYRYVTEKTCSNDTSTNRTYILCRPRYFPFRAIITIGSFSLSSNISTVSSGCTLRFIAEDSTMSLAPQVPVAEQPTTSRSLTQNKISSLPATDLVCVVDLGLFEISLRLNERSTALSPKFDMRATVNDLHLRTCSDSADALARLITYLATDGDLVDPDQPDDDEFSEQMEGSSRQQLVSTSPRVSNTPEITAEQQERVNSLMEEAMKESICVPSSKLYF